MPEDRPQEINPAKCRECGKRESRLNLELLRISCETAKVDPVRGAVSINYLVDLLNAVEKYLYRFDEAMIGAGKAKKEGLDTTSLVARIQDLQGDLGMYATIARSKLGGSINHDKPAGR